MIIAKIQRAAVYINLRFAFLNTARGGYKNLLRQNKAGYIHGIQFPMFRKVAIQNQTSEK